MDVEDVVSAKVLAGSGAQPGSWWPGGEEGKIDTDEKGTCPVAAAIAARGPECRVPHICKSPPTAHCGECTVYTSTASAAN